MIKVDQKRWIEGSGKSFLCLSSNEKTSHKGGRENNISLKIWSLNLYECNRLGAQCTGQCPHQDTLKVLATSMLSLALRDLAMDLVMNNIMTQWIKENTRFRGNEVPSRLDILLTKELEVPYIAAYKSSF